jgi:hypothetical protein
LDIQLVTCPTCEWGVTSEVPRASVDPMVSSLVRETVRARDLAGA